MPPTWWSEALPTKCFSCILAKGSSQGLQETAYCMFSHSEASWSLMWLLRVAEAGVDRLDLGRSSLEMCIDPGPFHVGPRKVLGNW